MRGGHQQGNRQRFAVPKKMISAVPPGCGIAAADAACGGKRAAAPFGIPGESRPYDPRKTMPCAGPAPAQGCRNSARNAPERSTTRFASETTPRTAFRPRRGGSEPRPAPPRRVRNRLKRFPWQFASTCSPEGRAGSRGGTPPLLWGGCARRAADRHYDGPATVRA